MTEVRLLECRLYNDTNIDIKIIGHDALKPVVRTLGKGGEMGPYSATITEIVVEGEDLEPFGAPLKVFEKRKCRFARKASGDYILKILENTQQEKVELTVEFE